MRSEFYVVVVDNGSTDGSFEHIMEYLESRTVVARVVRVGGRLSASPAARECIVCRSDENLGFARGNNEALRMLAGCLPDSLLFLNNDTLVEPDFLDVLNEAASAHTDYCAFTPMICYESRRDVIWNCGGRLALGMRKYYYAGCDVAAVRQGGIIPVTFVTGCALYFRPCLLLADGGLFTEKFFFGEEDFNFCLRMKRERQKMGCVTKSKIYHKVSASTAAKPAVGKIYIHYLNRFMDMRQNSARGFYVLWAAVNAAYVTLLLARRRDVGLRRGIRLVASVLRDSRRMEGVDRACFTAALNRRW